MTCCEHEGGGTCLTIHPSRVPPSEAHHSLGCLPACCRTVVGGCTPVLCLCCVVATCSVQTSNAVSLHLVDQHTCCSSVACLVVHSGFCFCAAYLVGGQRQQLRQLALSIPEHVRAGGGDGWCCLFCNVSCGKSVSGALRADSQPVRM